jgi:hypothetical protein
VATVREIAPGRWELRVYLGKDPLTGKPRQPSRTVDATGKRDAQLKANALELELRGEGLSGDGGTFGELLEVWHAYKAANNRNAPSSVKTSRILIDAYLMRPLGKLDVRKIRTEMLDDFYSVLAERGGRCQRRPCTRPRSCGVDGHAADCRRQACIAAWRCPVHDGACAAWARCEESPCEHGGPLAVSSVCRIHNVVRSALERAVIMGWRTTNPAEHADPGRVLEEETDPPDDPDVIRLLAEAEETEYALATYLALAIEAGARRGAMHAERWTYWSGPFPDGTSEIRFPKVISIGLDGPVEMPATRAKKSGRKVTLGPHVTAMLVTHHDEMFERALAAGGQLPTDAFIFSNDLLGAKPWRPEHTTRRFGKLRRSLNLDDETQLRHLRDLMATKLLSARANPKMVGDRGGWKKLATMLDRYAHVLPADDADAAGIVDRIYGR